MNQFLFIGALLALQALCWWVGKRSMKGVSTQQDYYLGGKRVTFLPLMMTFLATQVGGGIVMGSSQEAFRYGWWVLFYPIGQVLGLALLGSGIGKKLASFGVSTVAQIFGVYFNSTLLKRFASLLSIVSLFIILVGQVLASHFFLKAIGLDAAWFFYLFWIVLIAYTSMGGMKAVIATDLILASFFIAVFIAAFGIALGYGQPLLPQVASSESLTLGKINGWLLMPMLFTFIEQDMAQRCFAAKSTKTLSRSTWGAAIVTLLVCLVPVYFGTLGRALGADSTGNVLIAAVSLATNPSMAALVGCAVIAAILSTADALINAVGSNLSQDFFPNSSMKRTRLLAILIGAAAMLVSRYFDNIVDVLLLSYELSVSCLLIPLLFALFGKGKGTLSSAITSISLGGAAFFLFRWIPSPIPKELATLALSLLGYLSAEGVRLLLQRRADYEQA